MQKGPRTPHAGPISDGAASPVENKDYAQPLVAPQFMHL